MECFVVVVVVCVLTQALYETGNEWVGARVSRTKLDELFKMTQKMQTHDKMNTTKGHPGVPQ